MTPKRYKDTIHGFEAVAGSRTGAWGLIRNKCHEEGLQVPMMNEVEEIGNPSDNPNDVTADFISRWQKSTSSSCAFNLGCNKRLVTFMNGDLQVSHGSEVVYRGRSQAEAARVYNSIKTFKL